MVERAGPHRDRLWYLGLGSNLGDRKATLARAIAALDAVRGLTVLRTSGIYETDPWGDTDQRAFLNMAAELRASLTPHELLAAAKRIEQELGRRARHRWGPREIDIDLLLSGHLRVDTDELVVPHPLIGQRQFVLVPLAELDPELQVGGRRVADLVTDDGSVRPWPGAEALAG